MTPDVNVLVAAFRVDHSHHVPARTWLSRALEACATGGTLEILPMVAAAFVRLVTDARVFRIPDSARDAHAFLRNLLAADGASMPHLGSEWNTFERLCIDLGVVGEDVPDAWIAAVVTADGLHLVTFDRDFTRLLRPTQYTLLSRTLGIAESRPKYGARKEIGRAHV